MIRSDRAMLSRRHLWSDRWEIRIKGCEDQSLSYVGRCWPFDRIHIIWCLFDDGFGIEGRD